MALYNSILIKKKKKCLKWDHVSSFKQQHLLGWCWRTTYDGGIWTWQKFAHSAFQEQSLLTCPRMVPGLCLQEPVKLRRAMAGGPGTI